MARIYDDLEQLFHQPSRLELMTELCSADDALSFRELKDSCNLTDGNLSRHLKALETNGAVKIKKTFQDTKPLTTVSVTKKGRDHFLTYLDTLEKVLTDAAKRARGTSKVELRRKKAKA